MIGGRLSALALLIGATAAQAITPPQLSQTHAARLSYPASYRRRSGGVKADQRRAAKARNVRRHRRALRGRA